jgi:predicted cupin superfamily sugar epimerase
MVTKAPHPQAQALIAALQLEPHPEGGYYRQTYRSEMRVAAPGGPERRALTSIFFLLHDDNFSAFHRLSSDEIWHFYRGAPVAIEIIDASGEHETRALGGDGPFQAVLPAGAWFGAHMVEGGYALVGCDVAPGFDFADFEMPARAELVARHPQHAALIERWTRLPK